MKDIRCPICNQLLLKADVVKGQIKCTRCKKIINLNETSDRVCNTNK